MLYEGSQVSTNQASEPKTLAAPVGGLNGKDSLANMNELDAYQLDNMFPGTSTCRVRPGVALHQAIGGAPVKSLEVFSSGTTQHLLAFRKPNVQNATAYLAPTNLKSNLNGDEVVATMFSTVADNNQWLIITTGADQPMSYNGTVLADLVFTGNIDPTINIDYVCSYNARLFFGTENRLGFYYLPPGQIQGLLEWFDLGQLSVGGGFLQAITTFSMDAGDGPNDYILFITNRGEILVFQGLDPGDPNAWEIVGRYRASEPIGRKCVIRVGSDVLILTTEGVQQVSSIRQFGESRLLDDPLSAKLGDILLRHNVNRDVYGWCMCLWPVGGMLFVNAPDTGTITGTYHQFVMNTITKAWCKFSSDEWNPLCMVMMNKKIYFGRYDGSIRVIDGQMDNGKPIKFTAKQAYNYFNTPQHKHFKWAQFLLKSEAPVSLASNLSVDYIEKAPSVPAIALGTGPGGEWDVSYWDLDYWATGPYTQRWIAPYGVYGVAASHWLEGTVSGASFEWYATEHVFEKASGLL